MLKLICYYPKLRALHSALSGSNNYPEQSRTPRRRPNRDRHDRRDFSGNQPRQHSRSRSPRRSPYTKHPSQRRSSPPPYQQSNSSSQSPSKRSFFQPGADLKGPPVCAVCLGRNICEVNKCRAENFWDGSKARCQKNDQGRLITPVGTVLCHDWNTRRGCSSPGHPYRHECSGCGKKDHGAQNCPRAQKENAPHAI